MMKIFLTAFLYIFASLSIHAQEIAGIKLNPPVPKAGQFLTVQIDTRGLISNTKISVEFITWSDSNGDQELSEVREHHTYLNIADNSTEDLDRSENAIKLNLLRVPLKNAPLKYTVIAKVKNSSQSASIDVTPSSAPPKAISPGNSHFTDIYEHFKYLASAISLSLRASPDSSPIPDYHRIFRYNLKNQKVELIRDEQSKILSFPVSAADNSRIAYLAQNKQEISLNICEPGSSTIQTLDTGNFLKTPCWMFDNVNLLYVKDTSLNVVNTKTKAIRSLGKNLFVDRLISYEQNSDGKIVIIYRSKDPHIPDKFKLFLLVLTQNFEPVRNTMLANTLAPYFKNVLNPVNNKLVTIEPKPDGKGNTMSKIVLHTLEKEVQHDSLLFKDDFQYGEASWSPDGKFLLFISTRLQ